MGYLKSAHEPSWNYSHFYTFSEAQTKRTFHRPAGVSPHYPTTKTTKQKQSKSIWEIAKSIGVFWLSLNVATIWYIFKKKDSTGKALWIMVDSGWSQNSWSKKESIAKKREKQSQHNSWQWNQEEQGPGVREAISLERERNSSRSEDYQSIWGC